MKIGATEMLLIFVIILFVAGPDKLPLYIKKIGDVLKGFKDVTSDATKELRENVVEPLAEAQKPLREAMEPITDITDEINTDMNDIKKSFNDATKPLRATPSRKPKAKKKAETETASPEEKAEEIVVDEMDIISPEGNIVAEISADHASADTPPGTGETEDTDVPKNTSETEDADVPKNTSETEDADVSQNTGETENADDSADSDNLEDTSKDE
ncbi:MAG: twin-arginine translocase TatA/TatE family subunit [Lachnospiraceae bacterium]|nr:twin-arginine translocase TatA/TatE family subunit [Lachnospiraceae bacterium]